MRCVALISMAIAVVVLPGCTGATPNSAGQNQDESNGETGGGVDGLVASLKKALESRDGDGLYGLFYTEGQPEELSEVMLQQMKALAGGNRLSLKEIRVEPATDYTPQPELPGELNGKQLEFLRAPSHWVVANMAGGGDSGANLSMELNFPACNIDGDWKLVGSRYKEE